MHSLRRKITVGFSVIAALVVGLALFSFFELRLAEERIVAGERISEFLNITLEIRRFEKNYFLFRQASDFEENRAYIEQGQILLRDHAASFEAVSSREGIERLATELDHYGKLTSAYTGDDAGEPAAAEIRQAGKDIVTVAETMARTERRALQGMLDRHRHLLIGAVVGVALLVVAIVAMLTPAFNLVMRQLEMRQRQLLRSEKLAALGTLLSGVAHEINNPLSNISTSCEILAEEVSHDGTPFEKELLEQIDAETWRARRIVRSLLDYARDREYKREVQPLAVLVEDTLRLVRGRIPAEVQVVVKIPAGMTVSGDRQRLQQVLLNLFGNAIEALGGAGEIGIEARRTMVPLPGGGLVFGHCPEQQECVELAVRDNGHGMPADVLPRIFDPFFTTKEVGKGLGLGLFIVFEIVEEHGGCIAVESELNKGTCFRVRLPTGES
jgi:two-component system, NtrC family, sensor kinase